VAWPPCIDKPQASCPAAAGARPSNERLSRERAATATAWGLDLAAAATTDARVRGCGWSGPETDAAGVAPGSAQAGGRGAEAMSAARSLLGVLICGFP